MPERIQSLRHLSDVRPLYFLPNEPLAEEVLIPAFQTADAVDCMAGFFSSAAFASLAPGLATYIANAQKPMRLVISPLLRPEDLAAIESGLQSADSIAQNRIEEILITQDEIQLHTLRCLSYLLSTGRITIKIALMNDAIFHPKVWLFRSIDDTVVAHGSSNLTLAGLTKNIEQIAVAQSWLGPNDRYMTDKFTTQFERLYEGNDDSCVIVTLPQAIHDKLLATYLPHTPPTEDDLRELYRRATQNRSRHLRSRASSKRTRNEFTIPPQLQYTDGPFAHQGNAVNAWCAAGHRGVLEMATGSGKTIAAMICAHRLHETTRPLLTVVAAPYIPLIRQWCDEIATFGVTPVNLAAAAGARARSRQLAQVKRRLRAAASNLEIIVVSHDTLCSDGFKDALQGSGITTLLIADEVHNLGRDNFILNPPSFFDFRPGLSATPIRQYDDDGTAALFAFFGPVVFRFSLQEAIGSCLVEYDYHVHSVDLTPNEMDTWLDITDTIRAHAWRHEQDPNDEYLLQLFRNRRSVLESAVNKIPALDNALATEDLTALRHTLVYASDKAPDQPDRVNSLLKTRGVLFRQLTHVETADHRKTADILDSFRDGALQVLTAKRVLDEGVNIPQVRTAYILASTTVERQWIQRRGRLLRKCPEIGKTHSTVHDFVALPPTLDKIDADGRKLVRSELTRIQEFASLARNAGRPDGPLSVIRQLSDIALG